MTRTIDADGHVIEPADLWERELPPSMRNRGFQVRWNADTRQEEVHVEGRLKRLNWIGSNKDLEEVGVKDLYEAWIFETSPSGTKKWMW